MRAAIRSIWETGMSMDGFEARTRRTRACLAAAALLTCAAAWADVPEDLTQLSFDDLMQIDVTSVSKRAEPLHEAAAAIFVLTREDIRRSGARTLPELLRLVPGLHVARTLGQTYAISARGFNSSSADKMEVLLDGRSVYTPLTSSVFWDALDTYIPDIDRIEVIRGPGATLWGANAVNGVINIVTRPATQTQGVDALASGSLPSGDLPHGSEGGVRGGWALGESGSMRAYVKAREDDNGVLSGGDEGPDGLRDRRGGFRADFAGSNGQRYSFGGDLYDGETDGVSGRTDFSGGNLHGRWDIPTSPDAGWSLEAYYDHSAREISQYFKERRDTWDLQLEHRRSVARTHALLFGAGYRYSRDHTDERAIFFDPRSRALETINVFFQDQIALADGAGTLTVGSKFEHHTITGFEWQPSVRLGWALPGDRFAWGAVSRAVRLPNRLDADSAIRCPPEPGIPACPPGTVRRIGNPDLDSETLLAIELGLRLWQGHRASLDLALFDNYYDDLRSNEQVGPLPLDVVFANRLSARGRGAELTLTWQALQDLRLDVFYSRLDIEVSQHDSTDLSTPASIEGSNPENMGGLRMEWTPTPRWSADAFLRVVDELPYPDVSAYAELNLRVAFLVLPDLELGLVGENLLDSHHPEFAADTPARVEVERAAFVQVRWTPR